MMMIYINQAAIYFWIGIMVIKEYHPTHSNVGPSACTKEDGNKSMVSALPVRKMSETLLWTYVKHHEV